MFVVIILTLVFAFMGVVFAMGKGAFLIAGYNTSTDEEKAKYDEKKLCRCFSVFCLAIAAVIAITGWVNTEEFALFFSLPIMIGLVVSIAIASNTYCKKKK